MVRFFLLLCLLCGLPESHAQYGNDHIPAGSGADKLKYKSKQEFIEAIISDDPSTRWLGANGMYSTFSEVKKTDKSLDMRINIPVLGANMSSGPRYNVNTNTVTRVFMLNEGLNTFVNPQGNFNFNKTDRNGKEIVGKDGKKETRFAAFFCEVEMEYGVEIRAEGSLNLLGFGAGAAYTQRKDFRHNKVSRRILIPREVGGETVNVSFLLEICHKHFINQKISGNKTVRDTLIDELNATLRNWALSQRFTVCRKDEDCLSWYQKKIIGMAQAKNFPRCVVVPNAQQKVCALRGLEGQQCPVFQPGYKKDGKDVPPKLISSGSFEFHCDAGLKCVQVGKKNNKAVGQCKMINPGAYRDPWDPYADYLELEFESHIRKFNNIKNFEPNQCDSNV